MLSMMSVEPMKFKDQYFFTNHIQGEETAKYFPDVPVSCKVILDDEVLDTS